jgi:hypothetical protein
MRTIIIDSKTFLQIQDNRDPEMARQRFIEKLTLSREKGLRSRIPFISDNEQD